MNTLTPPFRAGNVEFAYQHHYHLGFRTKRRVPVFRDPQRLVTLRKTLVDVCQQGSYHILECELEEGWVRLLLSVQPVHAPSAVARTIKANSSRLLFQDYPEIEREIGVRSLWSRGYYVRGVGDVTGECVQRYVVRQRYHHESERLDSHALALYTHPHPEQYCDLRPWSHCMAEFNCHLVVTPVHHAPAIDASIADELLAYVQRVAVRKRHVGLSIAILEDHMHMYVSLKPDQSPGELALTVLNNTWYWIAGRNPGALRLWDAPDFWTHSAFVRTAGAATTNQVRSYLRGISPDGQ